VPTGVPGAGLCNRCVHQAVVPTSRSVFSRCRLAERDPRFVKYPPVPVLRCPGFESDDRRVRSPVPGV